VEKQPFFEMSVTRKAVLSGIALVVTLLLAAFVRFAGKQLWDAEGVAGPAIVWLAYGYAQARIIFERHTRAALSLCAGALLLAFCVGSWFIEYDPVGDVDASQVARNLGPGWGHLLGSDGNGRSMALLLVKGTEGFFLPGLLAAAIALLLGVTLGALAGYLGGRTDSVITFVTTLIGAFPRLVFLLLVCAIADDPNMFLIGGVLGVLFVPQVAEAIRRRVLALKEEDFIIASRAHGIGFTRILFYHIVWLQCFPELVRQGLYLFTYVIFVECALSFLDLDTMPSEQPSWGRMLAAAKTGMKHGHYWHALVPTSAIAFATLGITALGDVVVGQAKEERL